MKYILTNKKNKIIAISEVCERIEEYRNIKLDDHNIAYAPDETINIYQVEEIPEGVCESKYCYTEERGFYKNENYIEPVNELTEIEKLKLQNESLQEQVTNLELALAEIYENGGN